MSRRVHPTHPLAPIGVSVAVLGLWWLVAHNGGSGWVQVLGDVVFGTLFIGVVGPSVVLARATVKVHKVQADGVAGLPLELEVQVNKRIRVRPVHPPGPEVFAGPTRASSRGVGAVTLSPPNRGVSAVTLLPPNRGVHESVILEIATAAPFGLQWWSKMIAVSLPEPVHVAPRRGDPVDLPARSDTDTGHSSRHVPSSIGEPRGVRPYQPGDVRRHVHWPATAHARELMVRELEEPAAEPVTVTVDLPVYEPEAERIAERALGTVLRLRDRGSPVVLATTELSGPVVAPVEDRRSAGRRLARAVARPTSRPGITVER